MNVCAYCKERISTAERDKPRPFPAFTVLGGLAAAVAGAASGLLLLVPAGLLAGAAVDCRRCEVCGNDIPEGQPSYRLMDEVQDNFGSPAYRPMPGRQPQAGPTQMAAPPTTNLSSGQQQASAPRMSPATSGSAPPPPTPPPQEYTFDENQGLFISRGSPFDQEMNFSLFNGPADSRNDLLPESPKLSPSDPFNDPFFCANDLATDEPISFEFEPPLPETPT